MPSGLVGGGPFGFAGSLAGALAAGLLGGFMRRPLPRLDGEVWVAGLSAPVEIARDHWGVPHILAQTEEDAFFGQGYCHAQDRLWQMELNRRIARGQLAEIFGAEALDLDRFTRRLGCHRAAAQDLASLDARTRLCLKAYTSGVNACQDDLLSARKLPVEFTLTRSSPRTWEVLDTLAFGRYFAFTQSPNWATELVRSRFIAHLGRAGAAALEPDIWSAAGDAVPRLQDRGPATFPRPKTAILQPGGPGGSNAWVVAGARSTTGRPLLATDPHLAASLPNAWYEAHLVGGPELNVAGATLPGVPGVAIGHNVHLAWGLTVSYADTADLYLERLDASQPARLLFRNHWEEADVVKEIILVRGRTRPWVEEVLISRRHGPLLTPTPALPGEDRPLSLRAMALEAPLPATALLALNRARDVDELREALRSWGTPSFDVVYADVHGNIGHQLIGNVPVRGRGEGLAPVPGWTGEYEWVDRVPYDELPRTRNPADGLWASANHDLSAGASAFIGRDFDSPARFQRIRQVLESRVRHSALDFAALQADEVSLPAREAAAIVAGWPTPADRLARRAQSLLQGWDGRLGADSEAAAVFEVFVEELIAARFGQALGPLFTAVLGVGPHPLFAPVTSFYSRTRLRTLAFLREWDPHPAPGPDAAPKGQAETGESAAKSSADAPGKHAELVEVALTRAAHRLRRELGQPAPGRWAWGRLHPLRLRHALSARPPLGLLFDAPPVPAGGDVDTVRAGGPLAGRLEAGGTVSSYRMIADLADWDATLSILPGGQSGHRGSPHYLDQLAEWRRGAYHSLPFTRPAVLRGARHTLNLTPREKQEQVPGTGVTAL